MPISLNNVLVGKRVRLHPLSGHNDDATWRAINSFYEKWSTEEDHIFARILRQVDQRSYEVITDNGCVRSIALNTIGITVVPDLECIRPFLLMLRFE